MVKEWLINLGFDVVKDKAIEKNCEKQVRERLAAHIERQFAQFEICSVEEELDFEGIARYVCDNLLDDAKKRLLGTKCERAAAQRTIIAKVKEYAKANTKCGEKRAANMVTTAISILRNYYRGKANESLLFMSAEITDTVIDEMTVQSEKIVEGINNVKELLDEININPIDKIILKNQELIREKKFLEVEENVSRIINGVWGPHSIHPYYGYTFKQIQGEVHLASVPNTPDAEKLYPPRFCCKGIAKMNGLYLRNITPSVIDYANRHQLTITLSISEAQKLLGNVPDPLQYEAEKLVGKEITIEPQPFPEAFACSISFNGIVEFDYVLLRTQEILDDGTVIISNIEQTNFPFYIEMRANLTKETITFNINISESSNKAMLDYARIIKKAEQNETISVKVLKLGKILASGTLGDVVYQSMFDSIDEEISFFEMIVAIEEYFKTTISLPTEIMTNEYNNACYIYELIKGNINRNYWDKLEFTIELTENLRKTIIMWDEKPYSIALLNTIEVPLWGEKYKLPIIRRYISVKPENNERLGEKVKVLDLGDLINLVYLPGSGEKGILEDSLQKNTDVFPEA